MVMDHQESAAVKLQYWWRKKLQENERNAVKVKQLSQWRQLTSINLQDTQLSTRLLQIRKSKRYEMMKYEHILNHPASEVNRYLREEADNPTDTSTEHDRWLERVKHDTQDRAASIIQRTFRRHYIRQQAKRYLRRIDILKPRRRIALLETITGRIGEKRYIRNDALHDIKTRLMVHIGQREKDAILFAQQSKQLNDYKRELAIISVLVNRSSVNNQILLAVGATSALAIQKATNEHRNHMDEMEDRTLLNIDLNKSLE